MSIRSILAIQCVLAATIAFALSGVIKAAHKKLDVVGVCVVAFVAAFGGGIGHSGIGVVLPLARGKSRSERGKAREQGQGRNSGQTCFQKQNQG